jgi:hypothetical protein
MAAKPSRPNSTRAARRLDRERRTIARMIGLYCRGHGHPAVANGLCASCGGLLAYAGQRMLLRHPWLTAMHYVDEWTRK